MRRRLVISYLLLLVLVLVALEVPLRGHPDQPGDRPGASPTGSPTPPASPRWPRRPCAAASSTPLDGRSCAATTSCTASPPSWSTRTGGWSPRRAGRPARHRPSALDSALAGRQASAPRHGLAVAAEPLVVAVPVSDGGEVLGAVVTAIPVDRARPALGRRLVAAARPGRPARRAGLRARPRSWLAGWVLRPVTELDAAAHEIAARRQRGPGAARARPARAAPAGGQLQRDGRRGLRRRWSGSGRSSRTPATSCATR